MDRVFIFRTAHAAACRRMAPNHSWRYGDAWEAGRGWVPKFGYRLAFAAALRVAWADARSIALHAEIEAELQPLPAETVRAMRFDAQFEPITAAGNARMREILAEAEEIEEAARSSIITARDHHHVAC